MPEVYGQDGMGDEAIAYLHYFYGSSDWYITEKDTSDEQHQAFGYVILNGDTQNAELGYISIEEMKSLNKPELDLYYTPQTLGEIKSEKMKKGGAISAKKQASAKKDLADPKKTRKLGATHKKSHVDNDMHKQLKKQGLTNGQIAEVMEL